ncbi:MAG: PAS domain S-box protein, partial [Rhodospirillales bacterium]|nr:PAS domain S-box protein [Rhodospirillales bacterium]
LMQKDGRTLGFESQVYCKGGRVIWISESAREIRDACGELIGFEGTTIDITGRKLAEGFPDGIDSAAVLLDGEDTFRRFADQDMEIYWGAYLGTPDEMLISGKLKDVAGEIHRRRSEARQKNGWIMDTYLIRKTSGPSE